MEDEQGEPFENKLEECYEEGDEDEIMVEIVGSDVFVDGVSGEKQGFLGFGEIGDFEGNACEDRGEIGSRDFPEDMGGMKMGESELGVLGSRGGHDYVVTEEVGVDYVVISEEKEVKDQIGYKRSDISTDGDCGIEAKNVDENVVAAESGDSIFEMDALVASDIQDENQGCLKEFDGIKCEPKKHGFDDASHSSPESSREKSSFSEKGDVEGVELDDFKDGASDINLQDLSCMVRKDKYLKNGGDMKTDLVANKPTEQADGGDIPEVNEDNSLNIDIRSDTEENQTDIEHIDPDMDMEDMLVDGRESELNSEEYLSETDDFKLSYEENMKPASSSRTSESGYLSPPKNEGNFAVSDLVWGKVRSHPWWPGQIFDPADASEKAVKHYKKDSYLVAYFGDQTFAWNDKFSLKPFRSFFNQVEKRNNSEAFQDAVTSALEEVSRRVELGLACSCIPRDVYNKIEAPIVENTGICKESSRRYGVDHSSRASYFEPNKFLQYVKHLALCPSSRPDRLDIAIAQAQLSAFSRFKGYRSPAEFLQYGDSLENDADSGKTSNNMLASEKWKHTPKDGSRSRKKRSLNELMGEKSVSLSSGRKRKNFNAEANGSDKRVSVYAAKVSTSTSRSLSKPSFKIGERISRLASQLTGFTSFVKEDNNDEMIIDGSPMIDERSEDPSVFVSSESFSVDEMLSQLELAAQKPKKGNSIQNITHSFYTGFRNSIASNRRGRKKKTKPPATGGSGVVFEFDDANDSYWTDRIAQSYSEEHYGEDGVLEKPVKSGRKYSHSRKKFSDPTAVIKSDESVIRRKQESSPAELILNFAEKKCVPSEINLNKIFRRFGPLMESETEVDHDSGRAKVIFKRGSDAEVAYNSAGKFSIFGPVIVDYQIGYEPLMSVKILPLAMPQFQEDEALMILH